MRLTVYLSTIIWKPIKGCSQTVSGRTCQKWNEWSPHKPKRDRVRRVIKLTGSSNHNKCAIADVADPKAWCYTVDSNKRWEYCSSRCTGSASSTDATPITDASSTDTNYEIFRAPTPVHPLTGTRFSDVPEQTPQIDKRSQYDQNGKCLKNCKSQTYSFKIFGESSTH